VNRQTEEGHFSYVAMTQGILGPELLRNFGEIKDMTRLGVLYEDLTIEGKKTERQKLLAVDPSFFSMFTLPVRMGVSNASIVTHDGILISESAAIQQFGKNNPVGQTICIHGFANVEVTGVFEDFPDNSHLFGDYIISFSLIEKNNPKTLSWNFNSFYTYLLMPREFDENSFNHKLNTFVHQHTPESWKSFNYLLQPLLSIHLDNRYKATNPSPSIGGLFIRITSAVGLVILILACLNYMNMATARSVKRSLEVGVRKVMGANRMQLVSQFLSESLIICTMSFLLGILWADLAVPVFNAFTGWKLSMNTFFADYRFVLGLVAFNLLLALIAGSYPAFFLSRFLPVKVLKGQQGTDSSRRLRKGLVLVQFALTTVLVIMVIVVFKQFDFMRNKDLGFNKEQLMLFNATLGEDISLASFKNELLKTPGVKLTATASSYPGINVSNTGLWTAHAPENNIKFDWLYTDHDYIPTLEIKLLAGRNFNANGTDRNKAVIINEQAAGILGWTPEGAIGKHVAGFIFSDSLPGEVIGVIKDFHVSSLKREVNPLVIAYETGNAFFIARLEGTNPFDTRDHIKTTVMKLAPNTVFESAFMDDFIEELYATEKKMGQFFGFFTVLAIIVGCSGLYALTAYEAERRVKELGIRKIMGATSLQLLLMLSKNFLQLVVVSMIVALPLAYYSANSWLRPFPYRVEWSLDIFLQAACGIIMLSWLTVIVQALRSSRLNPADALRHE
jgi:putative ABC transport system permease protein